MCVVVNTVYVGVFTCLFIHQSTPSLTLQSHLCLAPCLSISLLETGKHDFVLSLNTIPYTHFCEM